MEKEKRAENALRTSEKNYRLIFEIAFNLIIIVDTNGRIIECNSSIKKFLGYEKDEVIGQLIDKIIHPDYLKKPKDFLMRWLPIATSNTEVKRILIVEDDEEMQEIYRNMFKSHTDKYEIEIQSNAKAGLKKLEEKFFDLIILDIIMEPMAGDSFYVYLRENLKNKNTPVIVVSVLSSDVLENLKKMNNITLFQKPIAKEQLLKEIDEVLSS